MVPPPDDPISLRDAETAERIARSAARGRGADRRPTLDQLLRAFDEPEATPEARRRVAAALALAGIRTVPPVADAPEGSRLTLGGLPAGRGRAAKRAVAGVGALGLLLGGAGLAAGMGGAGDGDRLDALPAGATTAVTTTAASSMTTPTPATIAAATTAAATTTPATTTPAGPPAAKERPAAAKPKTAAPKKKKASKKKKRKKTRVTVRLSPSAPTFLCVDDGTGRVLFNGTLSAPRSFTAKRIRLNVGLASTRVTVNGKAFALSGSPAGADLTVRRRVGLPLGQRPCA